MKRLGRRDFFRTSALASITAGLSGSAPLRSFAQSKGSRPLVVSSANGLRANAKAMEMIRAGSDTLDAVVAGVNIVEDDPNDMSVGYGGLPNEEGEVELDASVMHGPTRRAGAVASIRHIKNPSKVAKLVLERTDHLLLVGEGALRFALAHGFKKEDLLTDESRAVWLKWKETMSDRDAWGPGLTAPDGVDPNQSFFYNGPMKRDEMIALADQLIAHPPTGTINCIAV
ncbi:MAG TPA: isoaspartyl peptidase/L-asparaginase, partial [Blastocatellia bacterium]|nr:isoaspartyl peptidase/L-asparaginase [Blastocatellia bacterium]